MEVRPSEILPESITLVCSRVHISFQAVTVELRVKTLPAQSKNFCCGCPIAFGQLKSRLDVMLFYHTNGVAHEFAQRGLADLLAD